MSINNPYRAFPNFVLRTPFFSVNFIKQLTSRKNISDEDFKIILNEKVIQEAIFLASSSLYYELQKWLKGELKEKKKVEKLKYSLLKYLSRMSSRCTPFGLFAGCALGNFDSKNYLSLKSSKKHNRHTRLDMNYLVALSQDLAKENFIKEQLLFYPNTSIYKVGEQLRYVEYYYKNSYRQHQIVAVDTSIYLDKVLEAAKQGLSINELSQCIVDSEITEEESKGFIDELVESQLLVSELEPSVSGPEFLDQILQVLNKLNKVDHLLAILKNVDYQLKTIDKQIGNSIESYIEISKKLEQLKTKFELNYLFQTDLYVNTETANLDISMIESLKNGISLFNKISLPPKENFLNKFKEAFYERFEEKEVSLSKVLDTEMGIGYKQDHIPTDISPLIDGLRLPQTNENTTYDIKWSAVYAIFQKKLFKALENKESTIKINDKDFKAFEENWDDLPDTISAMVEVVIIDGKQMIKFCNLGGSSAGNLLGRFCHANENLRDYTQQIMDFEAEVHKDKILAEIVHLPESRTGNILMRPSFRKFEIPYLAKSLLKSKNQITIDDLTVSVKNRDYISLYSKKHNKEVVPHLTNAHNFTTNSLPIYHFLCDMQTQQKRGFLGINLGPFTSDYDFIPRIEYEDLILSEAIWNIKISSILILLKTVDNDSQFEDELKKFKQAFNIPQYTLLTDGDNELLINFDNITSVKMLLQTVKKRDSFTLKEFLFSEDGIVKGEDDEEYYTNEVIFSFFNTNRIQS